jgi:serine/threonine protein kinase
MLAVNLSSDSDSVVRLNVRKIGKSPSMVPCQFSRKHKFQYVNKYSAESKITHPKNSIRIVDDSKTPPMLVSPPSPVSGGDNSIPWYEHWTITLPLIFGLAVAAIVAYRLHRNSAEKAGEGNTEKVIKDFKDSPQRLDVVIEEVKLKEKNSELVFFCEEHEKFRLDDLFDATADLQGQNICSSLFKVRLKNNTYYTVKRLTNFPVSIEEFGQKMRRTGNMKHPNILPLIGYHSTKEEKLLVYKYQSNGSLLKLLEDYIAGKCDFPWRLRLSIASGIARGLDFIHKNYHNIPHGKLKLSNILLDENKEPLISECGFSQFLEFKKLCIFSSNSHIAPEKTPSEQGDVYSFGIILLELLTGKTVEKSGIDLPKWIKAIVREEWTGEVFDKDVNEAGRQFSCPLLNIALKCVSHSPEDRPTMAEVTEKMEEVLRVKEDYSFSDISSVNSSQHDGCLLYSVITETWDTPASNY